MNSSFIQMSHILISTSGERVSGRSGGVEKRKENFGKTAKIPQRQRKALLLSVALVPCSENRAWPEVPLTPSTLHYSALLPWID